MTLRYFQYIGHHVFPSMLLVKIGHMPHPAAMQTGKHTYIFLLAINSSKSQGPIVNQSEENGY